MNLLKKACFVYFILVLSLLFVDSFEDGEKRAKYNGDAPNDNRTCNIPWKTSLFSEPYSSCWVMCKGRCIFLSRTTQWRCKKSKYDLLGNCHCCNDDTLNVYFDL
ncbi:PREDICTED: uncharacterized protein LOC107171180 [Diuraphis noxia]|uniref:uncharacterized protein LOC107171180 n=1 Tax=Diuraphis noxia TaxID=143948 RepID=UPI000763AFE9|nr:PREDICTED: uncharacterized protein LOC107171180 [Diuraphis noxia]